MTSSIFAQRHFDRNIFHSFNLILLTHCRLRLLSLSLSINLVFTNIQSYSFKLNFTKFAWKSTRNEWMCYIQGAIQIICYMGDGGGGSTICHLWFWKQRVMLDIRLYWAVRMLIFLAALAETTYQPKSKQITFHREDFNFMYHRFL